MIAESIRDMKTKITNKTKEKATSAKINKIQDKLKLTSNQINKIITELENYKIQIEENKKSGRSPRSANDPKTKFIKLYTETEIERKNELIRQMNDIEPETYDNFDKYVDYYNDNLKSSFPGVFGGPKSATGGKKSRRLRIKSNRKTKKKGRKSKK
jgi:biotin operon repressor